jgi:DNA-binding transcriptional LysR family regulator
VGAFATALAELVPDAIRRRRERLPAIAVSVLEGRSPALIDALLRGEADVVVITMPAERQLDQRLRLVRLLDEHLLVAVPSNHRLARRRVVHLTELAVDDSSRVPLTAKWHFCAPNCRLSYTPMTI